MRHKIIYFTRHAQALHNVHEDYTIRDAPLTPLGRQQSAELHHRTKDTIQKTAQLLVSSPQKRPMQTFLDGYPNLVQRLSKESVILLPELQEANHHACDIGTERELLEADPEFQGLDFSRLTPDWISKEGIYTPSDRHILERARGFRVWLKQREETEIVVVAHGDILRMITDGKRNLRSWGNAEVQVYTFQEDGDDHEAPLTPLNIKV